MTIIKFKGITRKFEMSNGICPGGEANKGLVEACVQCSLDENDRWKQAFVDVIICIIFTV